MRMTIEVALLISIISVSFSIYFGLKGNKRSDTKEIEERAKANAEINLKLDNISNITSEIKKEISTIRDDVRDHENRLTKIEVLLDVEHER